MIRSEKREFLRRVLRNNRVLRSGGSRGDRFRSTWEQRANLSVSQAREKFEGKMIERLGEAQGVRMIFLNHETRRRLGVLSRRALSEDRDS